MPQPSSVAQDHSRVGGRPENPLSSGLNDQSLATNNVEAPTVPSNVEIDKQHGDSVQLSDPPRPFVGGQSQPYYSQEGSPVHPPSSVPAAAFNSDSHSADIPSPRPVFGVSLEDLLKRDGSAIPLVVYQCLQAIDLFGLDVEGIYRLSGSAVHIAKLRTIFDYGKSALLSNAFQTCIPTQSNRKPRL